MKGALIGFLLKLGAASLVVTIAVFGANADGIPEPSLVLYGVVSDSSAAGSRVSFGTISWVFQPAGGGAPITISGILTNINDQFSYVVRVPCETELPGLLVSTGALKLASSPTSYDRSQVSISGFAAVFNQTSLTNLTLSSTDRGRIERIDLTVNLNSSGLLPDAWQLQYFGHVGINPSDDPDHDGMSNYAEYLAGTNPTDPQSRFEIVRVRPDPNGPFIDWSSVAGKLYTIQKSSSLQGGFSDLQNHVTATAPLNTFHDTASSGGGLLFYRIRVE